MKSRYQNLKCWGMLASIDLYECAPTYIRNPKKIRQFIIELCSAINMKRRGQAIIKRFGQDDLAGYSAMQFIETSSVTMHFDEIKNRAFIEIFSCQYFDPKKSEVFCKKFLKAKKSKLRYFFRY